MRDTFKADVVGSMQRPPALVEARQRMRAGELDAAEYARIEDEAVDLALRIQEQAGVDVVTDGEQRRTVFFDFFVSGLDGLAPGAGRTACPRGAVAQQHSAASPVMIMGGASARLMTSEEKLARFV